MIIAEFATRKILQLRFRPYQFIALILMSMASFTKSCMFIWAVVSNQMDLTYDEQLLERKPVGR